MKTSWQKKEIDDKKFRAEGENNHAKIEAKSLQEAVGHGFCQDSES